MGYSKKLEKCRKLPKSLEEYQWAFDIVIDHYKESGNSKAPKRAKHVIRVMQITQDLVSAAGWPKVLMPAAVIAACFHDIAKFDEQCYGCKGHAQLGAQWLQNKKNVKAVIRAHMGSDYAFNFMAICDSTAWHTKKSPPFDGDGEHTNGEHGLLDKDGFIVLTSTLSVLIGEVVQAADKLDKEHHLKGRSKKIVKKINGIFTKFPTLDEGEFRKLQDDLRGVEKTRLDELKKRYSIHM